MDVRPRETAGYNNPHAAGKRRHLQKTGMIREVAEDPRNGGGSS
jgi:phytoene/squalene synthetase